MLTVSAFIFLWLTAAYIRPVPASSYEYATVIPVEEEIETLVESTPATVESIEEIPVAEGAVVVK